MDSFDIADVGPWEDEEEEKEAGEQADPAARPAGAWTSEVLARGGRVWASVRRPRSCPGPAPAVAANRRPDGQCTSIEDVYMRYQHVVWSKLQRPDIEPAVAEEIHQDVFLTMDQLVHKNGLPDNVASMLATITGNLICNHLRQRERRPQFAEGVEVDELPASQPDVEQRVRRAEREQLVEVILAKLPQDAAMLIRWIDLCGLTQEEVAGILERPLKTVKTQHLRARARFRDLIKRLYSVDLGVGA
jgi:RNA polymerase sigma factor (sigma-70 family)